MLLNFIQYRYEFSVAVNFQILTSYFLSIFFQHNFSEFFFTSVLFFIHYFIPHSVICIASVAKPRFASVFYFTLRFTVFEFLNRGVFDLYVVNVVIFSNNKYTNLK